MSPIYRIPHGPGPPQRPQMGISVEPDRPDSSELTENTLSFRFVSEEWHFGQIAGSEWVIERWSFSKLWPHCRQIYSYIGITSNIRKNGLSVEGD